MSDETDSRIPAEMSPMREFVLEEMQARGWTTADMVARCGSDNPVHHLAIEILCEVDDDRMSICPDIAECIGNAFGTGPELWLNLDRSFHEWRKSK